MTTRVIDQLKEFYLRNHVTLIKTWDRPYWIGNLLQLVEFSLYMMIAVTDKIAQNLAEKDLDLTFLSSFSLGCGSSVVISIMHLVFLVTNIAIILTLFIYALQYLRKPYQNEKSKALSIIIGNYSAIAFTPALYFALKEENFKIMSYISIPLTVVIGNKFNWGR